MLNSTTVCWLMIVWVLVRVVSKLDVVGSVVYRLLHDKYTDSTATTTSTRLYFHAYYLVICSHRFCKWSNTITLHTNFRSFWSDNQLLELSIFSWIFVFIHSLVVNSIVFIVTDTMKKGMKWNVENWWQTVHWHIRFVIGEVGWWG